MNFVWDNRVKNNKFYFILISLLFLVILNNELLLLNNYMKEEGDNSPDLVKLKLMNSYVDQNPINIFSDAGFLMCGCLSFGNGTKLNPYILQGVNITNSSTNELIKLTSTRAHVIIKDSLLNGLGITPIGISLSNVTNVIIENVTISDTAEKGISMSNLSKDLIIINNTLTNNSYGIEFNFVSNITLSNNTVVNNNFYGIYIAYSNISMITENIVYNNSGTGIELWRSNYNNTVTNNIISENIAIGIEVKESFENNVSHNIISNHLSDGIRVSSLASQNIFVNNTLVNNSDNGISISNSSNNTFLNNSVENGKYGFTASNSDFSIFKGNTANNNSIFGFSIHSSSDSTELENNLVMNASLFGYYITSTDNNTIINNFAFNNTNYGMEISSSSNNVISNNKFIDNSWIGLHLNKVDFSIIEENVATSNAWRGIHLLLSENNTIRNNIANDSDVGIGTYENNHNNTFTNNTVFNNTDGFGFSNSGKTFNNYINNTVYNNENGFNLNAFGGSPEIKNSTFIGNKIFNNTGTGISIDDAAQFNNFSNNLIENNPTGIYITGGTDNLIENNNISSSFYGIRFVEISSKNKVQNNTFSSNSGFGVYLESGTSFNTISKNDFLTNKPHYKSYGFDEGSNNSFLQNYWSNHYNFDQDLNGFADDMYLIAGNANNSESQPRAEPKFSSHNLSTIMLISPNGGEIGSEIVTIQWTESIDPIHESIYYSIYISNNFGVSWILLAENLTNTSYLWNSSDLENGSEYLIKVIATDNSSLTQEDTSDAVFVIENEKESINTTDITSSGNTNTFTDRPTQSEQDFIVPAIILGGISIICIGLIRIRMKRTIDLDPILKEKNKINEED